MQQAREASAGDDESSARAVVWASADVTDSIQCRLCLAWVPLPGAQCDCAMRIAPASGYGLVRDVVKNFHRRGPYGSAPARSGNAAGRLWRRAMADLGSFCPWA